MFETLKVDLRRNLQDYRPMGRFRAIALCLTLNSAHAVMLLRFQFWCARHRLPTFVPAKILFWFFKIEVSKRAAIGPGLRLPHPMGIIIAPGTVIGSNCDLYADVRMVLSHGNPKGPVVGHHVFLGDGAKIVGHVAVGDHAVIGVSSVVTKDVPACATAVGIPAKVINPQNGRNLESD